MAAQQAQPLPECRGCGRPMLRSVWAGQDGECRECRDAQRRSVAQLEMFRRLEAGQ